MYVEGAPVPLAERIQKIADALPDTARLEFFQEVFGVLVVMEDEARVSSELPYASDVDDTVDAWEFTLQMFGVPEFRFELERLVEINGLYQATRNN